MIARVVITVITVIAMIAWAVITVITVITMIARVVITVITVIAMIARVGIISIQRHFACLQNIIAIDNTFNFKLGIQGNISGKSMLK